MHSRLIERLLCCFTCRRVIQDLLNKQTIHQFRTYAQQQYPDSVELQEHLITQLQEQHFQQYIQQMAEQGDQAFLTASKPPLPQSQPLDSSGDDGALSNDVTAPLMESKHEPSSMNHSNSPELLQDDDFTDEEEEDTDRIGSNISAASMWTRKDVDTFKESIRVEGTDGILKVGHGEIATIRVPTHENGNCIFWEFATDAYDIGFGLLFEWTSHPDNQVSIHISESEDDEEEEEGSFCQLEIFTPNSQNAHISFCRSIRRSQRRGKWCRFTRVGVESEQTQCKSIASEHHHSHLPAQLSRGSVCRQSLVPWARSVLAQV